MILLVVTQARTWFSAEGEPRLKDSYTTDDTLVCTETAIQHFEELLAEAKVLFLLLFFTELVRKVFWLLVVPKHYFLHFPPKLKIFK